VSGPAAQTEAEAETGGTGGAEGLRSRSSLPGPDDLPGDGWVVVEERSWRTGTMDPDSAKSRRARASDCTTAWRSLAQPNPVRRAWVEVVPYATAADAEVSLGQTPRFFVGQAAAGVTITDEHVVDEQAICDLAKEHAVSSRSGGPWLFEQSATGPDGDTVTRYVGVTVDRAMCLTCCAGAPATWSWGEVLGVAASLADGVRRRFGSADAGR
jgi:hypothetical protein